MKKIDAEHGAICALENEFFGYFGWPSVARLDGSTLVAVASGLRTAHVCPFGRTIISFSRDEGSTWTSPQVVNDSPLDDRDAGVIGRGNQKLLVSWFTTDTRPYFTQEHLDSFDAVTRRRWDQGMAKITDANTARWQGAWVRTSEDGGETWNPVVRIPVTAPHGPIRLQSGDLLYFGKEFGKSRDDFTGGTGRVIAMQSNDDGATWQELGEVPLCEGTHVESYHEPHVVELPSGKLIGVIRIQNFGGKAQLEDAGILNFSIMQTESEDGGRTWTTARPLGFHGSPPHILRHSSGVLVLSYGYRQEPYGERVALSRDDGATWEHDFVLRDDGPDSDLGYPASVELADGRVLTVYYQKPSRREDKCAFLWSRWQLPAS
ncbi:MAG TPA: sialidase family protein [Abditibacteriaceae bacterium]|nr:sialidase family protein [Abditibacteriaceae bacterium]